MSARVVICRHGNTFDRGQIVTRVGGRTDLPLSRSGEAQATALGQHFASWDFARAYTSDLKRTRETLARIVGGEPEVRPFLREIDYGPDENQPEAVVVARLGQAAIDAWDARGALPDGWVMDVDGVRAAWAAFMDEQARAGSTAIVMTSNGVARFVFSALGLDPGAHSIKLRTGAYGVLEHDGAEWSVTDWNLRPPAI